MIDTSEFRIFCVPISYLTTNKKFWKVTIVNSLLIRQVPTIPCHWKVLTETFALQREGDRHTDHTDLIENEESNHSSISCIPCLGNVYIELLLSNEKVIHIQTHRLMEGTLNYAMEKGSVPYYTNLVS
jgi:hypothetical protein